MVAQERRLSSRLWCSGFAMVLAELVLCKQDFTPSKHSCSAGVRAGVFISIKIVGKQRKRETGWKRKENTRLPNLGAFCIMQLGA